MAFTTYTHTVVAETVDLSQLPFKDWPEDAVSLAKKLLIYNPKLLAECQALAVDQRRAWLAEKVEAFQKREPLDI